jgi:hypothetical protein
VSILRGIGKFLGGFVFGTFLALSILAASFIELTEYNNLQPVAVNIISEQVMENATQEEVNNLHLTLLELCENKETIEMSLGEENITLNCSKIRETRTEELLPLFATETFDKIYYKKYDCEFIECIQEGDPRLLVSAHANSFFKNIQNVLWMVTVIGAIVLFISVKTWSGRLKSFGIILIVAGVPAFILNLNLLSSFIENSVPPQVMTVASPLINKFFDSISSKLLIVFISGIILTVFGYGLKYLIKKKS